jgi:hypothetical protein
LLGRFSFSCSLCPACLFTFGLRDCSSPTLWGSRSPDLFVMCLLIQLLVYYSVCFFFHFFPHGCKSVCPGDYEDLAQGCLWEYHMLFSSPGGLHLPKLSGSW